MGKPTSLHISCILVALFYRFKTGRRTTILLSMGDNVGRSNFFLKKISCILCVGTPVYFAPKFFKRLLWNSGAGLVEARHPYLHPRP